LKASVWILRSRSTTGVCSPQVSVRGDRVFDEDDANLEENGNGMCPNVIASINDAEVALELEYVDWLANMSRKCASIRDGTIRPDLRFEGVSPDEIKCYVG
jgi:hypothetical protein